MFNSSLENVMIPMSYNVVLLYILCDYVIINALLICKEWDMGAVSLNACISILLLYVKCCC